MGGRSGLGVWNGPRRSFNHGVHRGSRGKAAFVREMLRGLFRMSVLRSCFGRIFVGRLFVGFIFAVVLLAGCAFGQDLTPAPASTSTSTPSVPVSPPDDRTHTDLTPIDLKPDASGVAPAQQIRELPFRAE